VKQEDGVLMLGMREREEGRVGRLAIGMRMRKERKLELRELRGRGRLGDGDSAEGGRDRKCKIDKWNVGLWMQSSFVGACDAFPSFVSRALSTSAELCYILSKEKSVQRQIHIIEAQSFQKSISSIQNLTVLHLKRKKGEDTP
jgi:hypothetical protein